VNDAWVLPLLKTESASGRTQLSSEELGWEMMPS